MVEKNPDIRSLKSISKQQDEKLFMAKNNFRSITEQLLSAISLGSDENFEVIYIYYDFYTLFVNNKK